MTDVRDLLIRGSEKVIDHYRLLLAGAKTEKERELYLSQSSVSKDFSSRLRGGLPNRVAA